MNRIKEIIKTSFIGIIVNIALVIVKSIIGLISGSVSIIMDAVNNLSDSLSSIVNIVVTKISGKAPDKKHPYGHGKIEYISSIIIALIIFITGALSLYESITKIMHPVMPKYTITMIIVIVIGIMTKYFLSIYFKKKGQILNSGSLKATGTDAFMDAILSLATLIGALVTIIFKINIDGYLAAIISIFIIKSAVDIMLENFDYIIGTRIDSDLANNIKKCINNYHEVLGTYDLILHQYGPERLIGSVHIEVNDKLTAKKIHTLTRNISEEIFNKYGVILTVGIYASNTNDVKFLNIKKELKSIIKKYPTISQLHGFYVDQDNGLISFDIIFDYEEKNTERIRDDIISEISQKHPEYKYNIVIDKDFSD